MKTKSVFAFAVTGLALIVLCTAANGEMICDGLSKAGMREV